MEKFFSVVILLLIIMSIVAFLTYIERKLLAAIQLRKGPCVVGWCGLLQPIADCLKLINKQVLWPKGVSKVQFIIPPMIALLFPILCFCLTQIIDMLPIVNSNYSMIFIVGLSMLGAFGMCIPGLIMHSTYAQLGSYRAIIQMISYELCITLCVLNVGIMADGYSFEKIVSSQKHMWNIIPLIHVFFIYVIASLAETNRTPFDTLEAEQELVAGYHTEYSSILFCVFYISEYANIFLMSILTVLLFLGGWNSMFGMDFIHSSVWFGIKVSFILFIFLITRGILPRYRFSNIITLFWRRFMPILFVTAFVLFTIILVRQ